MHVHYRFVARTLSFKDRAFDVVNAEISTNNKRQYDACSRLLQDIIEKGVLESNDKVFKAIFWASCQVT